MRPIRIEMTNFGPFRQETVDFASFDESSLFLISGRTGAGKSSIFDAMTYALFNETSSDRTISELRSTFAGIREPKTRVVFYFEQHNQIYRAERLLDLKPKLKIDRGKGIATKEASLVVVDGIGGVELEKLASKPNDTTRAVEKLLQLKASQFKQIILLPQYQFSEFLKAPTSEKIPILRQIFGTQIFADFEQALAAKWSQVHQEQTRLLDSLASHYRSQIWTEKERSAFAAESDRERLRLAQEFLQAYQATMLEAKKCQVEAQATAKQAETVYQNAKGLMTKFRERDAKQQQYQTDIVAKEEQWRSSQKRLEELNFASDLAGLIKEENAKQTSISQLEVSAAQLNQALQEEQVQLEPLEVQLHQLEAQETEQEDRYASIQTLALALNNAKSFAKQEASRQVCERQLTDLLKQLEILRQTRLNLNRKQAEIEQNLISTENLEEAREEIVQAQHLIENKLDPALSSLEELRNQIRQLDYQLEENIQEQASQEQEQSQLQAKLVEKRKDQRQLMIAQLQADLQEGIPCPICGSLEHPAVTSQEVEADNLIILMQAVEELDKKHRQLTQSLQASRLRQEQLTGEKQDKLLQQEELCQRLARDYRSLQVLLDSSLSEKVWEDTYSTSLGQLVLAQLRASYHKLQERRKEELISLDDLAQELEEVKQKEQEGERQQSSLEGQIQTLKQSLAELQRAFPNLQAEADYKKQIAEIQQDYQSFRSKLEQTQRLVAEHKEHLSGLAGRFTTQKEHLKRDRGELKEVTEALNTALGDESALTHERQELENWLEAVRDGQLSQLQTWVTKYEQTRQLLETDLSHLDQTLKGEKRPDLDFLARQNEQAQEAFNHAGQALAISQRSYEQVRDLVEQIQDLMTEADHQMGQFSQLTALKNIISGGEKGQQRLKLETYVIQGYLEEILDYANNHYIGLLSNQEFEFILSNRQFGGGQSGLDINIYNRINNKELPASSLSGGETFIASLAIALSMSEVVQNTSNGALIEALFIDEGFGSLDEETLDKAISVLEQIGQNRMVGVISHVKEMKDTIQQQLLITKSLDGSSHIQTRL
ncbi:AAA family ATPase [Streptococcus dentasini]